MSFLGLFGLAGGGPASKGRPYIVGENRAEVFVPDEDGRIVPSIAAFMGSREYGGDVTARNAYLTGERRPEVFVPNSSSGSPGAGFVGTQIHLHINGVTDADSFQRSKTQIYADMQHEIAQAHYRTRGGF